MTGKRKLASWIATGALVASLMSMPAVQAQGTLQDDAERMANEAAKSIMDALGYIMQAIPQYHAPEVMDNGDIIIRRKQPGSDDGDGGDDPKDEDSSQQTNT